MSVQEIDALEIKSDLKRAMKFVSQLGHQSKSQHTAEILAAQMINNTEQSRLPIYELWRYDQEFTVHVTNKSSITISGPFVFLKDKNKAFVAHVWVDLNLLTNSQLLSKGVQIGMADHNVYNQHTRELLQKRYP